MNNKQAIKTKEEDRSRTDSTFEHTKNRHQDVGAWKAPHGEENSVVDSIHSLDLLQETDNRFDRRKRTQLVDAVKRTVVYEIPGMQKYAQKHKYS